MTLVVTGATGHLGRLVVESLLKRGVPAEHIVATGRSTDKIADLADLGVQVRAADFNDPAALRAAFADADKVLLVSGSEIGQRATQHQNVIDAAREAGVNHLVYTSIPHADRAGLQLAREHHATEQAIIASGVPHTFLRNSWYFENYTPQLPVYLEHGAVLGSAGEGRVSAAARADYAEAAAAVLTSDGHVGQVYELGGDEAFTLAELAATVGDIAGRPVVYTDLPASELAAVLVQAGLPEPYAAILADADLGLGRGELLVTSGDLRTLIGRPPVTLREAITSSLG